MSPEPEVDFEGPGNRWYCWFCIGFTTCFCVLVDFNHFHILRAIGKGAFGKVSSSYNNSAICKINCLYRYAL